MGYAINCGGCGRSVIDELAVLWDDVGYCVACVSSFLVTERDTRKKAERERDDYLALMARLRAAMQAETCGERGCDAHQPCWYIAVQQALDDVARNEKR